MAQQSTLAALATDLRLRAFPLNSSVASTGPISSLYGGPVFNRWSDPITSCLDPIVQCWAIEHLQRLMESNLAQQAVHFVYLSFLEDDKS